MIRRIQVYLVAAAVFVFGLFGAYFSGAHRAADRERIRIDRERLRKVKTAKDIRDDIQSDPHLADRARRWVRDDD